MWHVKNEALTQGQRVSCIVKNEKYKTCWCSAVNEKWNDPKKKHPTGGFRYSESPKTVLPFMSRSLLIAPANGGSQRKPNSVLTLQITKETKEFSK